MSSRAPWIVFYLFPAVLFLVIALLGWKRLRERPSDLLESTSTLAQERPILFDLCIDGTGTSDLQWESLMPLTARDMQPHVSTPELEVRKVPLYTRYLRKLGWLATKEENPISQPPVIDPMRLQIAVAITMPSKASARHDKLEYSIGVCEATAWNR